METIELLGSVVITKFNELYSYTDLYNKKSGKDMEKVASSKLVYEKNPEDIDVNELARDVLYINGFHQVDIRKMQDNFINVYNAYKEIGGEDALFSEELLRTVGVLKSNLNKQFFTVEKNKFVEIESGRLEKAIESYEEKGLYKIFEDQITKLLVT